MAKEEFGFYAKDEDGVILSVCSNHGKDKKIYLENAKKIKRPILILIESELFDKYQFVNFALTVDEAKNLVRELTRMVDYIEDI
jgi:hypothetical protein